MWLLDAGCGFSLAAIQAGLTLQLGHVTGTPKGFLKHKVSRGESADKNYRLSDLVEAVLELVGIPL